MKLKARNIIMLIGLSLFILGGCSKTMNVSAEEIIHNAIESEKDVDTYYGESKMKITEGEDVIEEATMKEYVGKDGKRKITTESKLNEQTTETLNDGEKLIVYEEGKDNAYEMDLSEVDTGTMSPKEQIQTMLKSMENSHEYELVGEEKVLDLDTYHIKLTAKEKDNLFGDMELWIDQKTWFVVKTISETGDDKMEVEYTKLDFSPKFDDTTFTIDIPDGVEISSMEDNFAPKSVTLEEVEETFGQPFLIIPDGEDIQLNTIEMNDLTESIGRYEADLEYTSSEDVPMFFLTIFPTPEGDDMEITSDKHQIRGNNALIDEEISNIAWDEDGLRYSIIATNPDMSIEDMIALTEKMTLSTDN